MPKKTYALGQNRHIVQDESLCLCASGSAERLEESSIHFATYGEVMLKGRDA